MVLILKSGEVWNVEQIAFNGNEIIVDGVTNVSQDDVEVIAESYESYKSFDYDKKMKGAKNG